MINSLIQSKLVHKLSCLPTPPDVFFKKYKTLIKGFLWGDSPVKIAYDRLMQDYPKLGLKLVDLETKNVALKAAWPVKWKNRPVAEIDWTWQNLPIRDPRVWQTNMAPYDLKDRKKILPLSTLNSIWVFWNTITYSEPQELEEILNSTLWGNSLVRRRNKPILHKKLLNTDIDRFLAILLPLPTGLKLMTWDEMINTHREVIDSFYYMSLLASIPSKWKIAIRNEIVEREIDLPEKVDQFSHNTSVSKQIYWTYIENQIPCGPLAMGVWKPDLGYVPELDKFSDLFPNFLQQVYATKLHHFQYKILTRTLVTNKLRNKWNPTIDSKCGWCELHEETILHLMVSCTLVSQLWKQLEKWLKYFLKVDIHFTPGIDIV